MKRTLAWVLALAMLLAACAFAEGEAPTFESLAGLEWSFSSGAGGWSTEMRLDAEGAFSGEFHDSEMGESATTTPTAPCTTAPSPARCPARRMDEHAWSVRVDSLTVESPANEESIEDDIRYVTAEPYGMSEGDELKVYAPGTPVDALTEEMQMWAHLNLKDDPSALEDWFLYSEANDSGFVGYPP